MTRWGGGFELNGEMLCGCLSGLDESCISDERAQHNG